MRFPYNLSLRIPSPQRLIPAKIQVTEMQASTATPHTGEHAVVVMSAASLAARHQPVAPNDLQLAFMKAAEGDDPMDVDYDQARSPTAPTTSGEEKEAPGAPERVRGEARGARSATGQGSVLAKRLF